MSPSTPLEAPVAVEPPAPPSSALFSPQQWAMVYALVEGVLPAIGCAAEPAADHDRLLLAPADYEALVAEAAPWVGGPAARSTIEAFLAYRPSTDDRFRREICRALAAAPQKRQFARILNLLATRLGSLLLTGYWQPFDLQPLAVREAILRSWASSALPRLRVLAKMVAATALKANANVSPFHGPLSGYSDLPPGWKPGPGFDYRFLQLEAGDEVLELETDVVVVGSGCGGAVAAKVLAEAGHAVLVLDKGYYFPPEQLPMAQEAAYCYLFDHGGCYISDDMGISVVCGGAWGGGGTVNWSVCLRLQDFVRREWAAGGLPFFTSPDFEAAIERVWHVIGASTAGIRHNHGNRTLLQGCARLGWRARPVDQNTAGREHYCGQCHLGCGSAEKRGPTVCWLPAAAAAGARFLEGFRVDGVSFAPDGRTATGVHGLWTSRGSDGRLDAPAASRVQRWVSIKAKKVILSAGSLWNPLLLRRSGIQNYHLGRNLHLHPCNFLSAAYADEVRPWEGGIITSCSDEFENLDGNGHGVKLEPVCMVPSVILAVQPWLGGVDAKMTALKYRHLSGFIALTRDRDSGRVYEDEETGEPRIEYVASDFDSGHTLEGVQALAKICYVTGAKEIRPHLPGLQSFVAEDGGERQAKHAAGEDPEFTDPVFAEWLRQLRRVGNRPPATFWSNAHQMGTCRMSSRPEDGVVDSCGAVWGTNNLYLADASVFPSASGVNPMVTVMALSDWISRGVAAQLSEA